MVYALAASHPGHIWPRVCITIDHYLNICRNMTLETVWSKSLVMCATNECANFGVICNTTSSELQGHKIKHVSEIKLPVFTEALTRRIYTRHKFALKDKPFLHPSYYSDRMTAQTKIWLHRQECQQKLYLKSLSQCNNNMMLGKQPGEDIYINTIHIQYK